MNQNINNKKIKCVKIIGSYGPKERWGGMNTYVENFEKYLLAKGIEVDFIPPKLQKTTTSYSSLPRIFISTASKKIPKDAIIYAQRPDDLMPFIFLARENPAVCVLHGDTPRKMKIKRNAFIAAIYRLLESLGLKRADHVIAVNKETLDIYQEMYPWLKGKSSVIPVGVDTEHFKPQDKKQSRKNLHIPLDKKVLLVIARLEKEKNVRGVIEIVKLYLDTENILLLIAGTGKDMTMLKQLASGVENATIRFLGQVPYKELPKIINAADVLIVPSLFESGPLVIIEAMACGVPCVSTDVGRAREFLDDSDCGYVVKEPGAEFASKIEKLYSVDPASIKDKCINNVNSYSFGITVERTLGVFEKLMEV